MPNQRSTSTEPVEVQEDAALRPPCSTREIEIVGTCAVDIPQAPDSILSTSAAGRGTSESSTAEPSPESPAEALPTIRKRPRISDFQNHYSTSQLPSDDHPAQLSAVSRPKLPNRRCVSASPHTRARTYFNSPDRYLPQRPTCSTQNSSYRVNKIPSVLTGPERYTRQHDHSVNPFRSTSPSRSANAVGRRPTPSNLSPPYHIPSFVRLPVQALPSSQERANTTPQPVRQISVGGVWNVGGRRILHAEQIHAVIDGHGGFLASGTNAPMHTTHFLDHDTEDDILRGHERRLAVALDIDQAARVLLTTRSPRPALSFTTPAQISHLGWQDKFWTGSTINDPYSRLRHTPLSATKAVPSLPFRVLDAPNMKDDYYCSILAYSQARRTLAVALTNRVYLWTEASGVHYPPFPPARAAHFVTCLSFSSNDGGKSILAISRHNGRVSLWSLLETEVRFDIAHLNPASCLSFRPSVTHRQSVYSSRIVPCEDLLVADDAGYLYFYCVEWPDQPSVDTGSMTLLTKIQAHSQNICGLAWSSDGEHFATGGNDNCALIFETATVLNIGAPEQEIRGRTRQRQARRAPSSRFHRGPERITEQGNARISPPSDRMTETTETDGIQHSPGVTPEQPMRPAPHPPIRGFLTLTTPIQQPQGVTAEEPIRPAPRPPIQGSLPLTPPASPPPSNITVQPIIVPTFGARTNLHMYSFYHSAAVKALAFAPWQPSLLATGGGSNDRQIHFHHIGSGATLAIINVFAQVTSLVWSQTRREIAATFGYAQPEHEIRIAVFAWPSCECVVAIPWEKKAGGEYPRALWAIGYPGGPNDAAGRDSAERRRRRARERERIRGRNREEDERLRAWNRGDLGDGMPRVAAAEREGGGSESVTPEGRATNHRREGATWASRTGEEGSLIIACCDETVKFFEVWAGRSKGNRKGRGLGNVGGVLGGSRILEGELGVDLGVERLIGGSEEVIR